MGWVVPPPSEPSKGPERFRTERRRKIDELERRGPVRSQRIRDALLGPVWEGGRQVLALVTKEPDGAVREQLEAVAYVGLQHDGPRG